MVSRTPCWVRSGRGRVWKASGSSHNTHFYVWRKTSEVFIHKRLYVPYLSITIHVLVQTKTPYKNPFGWIHQCQRQEVWPLRLLHSFGTDNCMLAGGSYCPPSQYTESFKRQSIYENIDEYVSIVERPFFSSNIFRWYVVAESFWKLPPKVSQKISSTLTI